MVVRTSAMEATLAPLNMVIYFATSTTFLKAHMFSLL